MFGKSLAGFFAALIVAGPAAAEVVDVQPSGFEVREVAQFNAPPAKVWAALVQIGRWWSPVHTFSHDAANLTLDPRAGGCFCETLKDGGSVAFMRVIYVAPGSILRLEGALGPLQTTGASGHLAWTLKAKDGGTELTSTYDVGGYACGGFGGWAPVVDRVLGEQYAGLKRFVETGAR
jgi:uncharacterized protein YndB with AHSA1/START domain